MITLYHGSRHKFDFPEYHQCVEQRSNHRNGELGLWFSMSPEWIGGFGEFVYVFDADYTSPYVLPLHELAKWANVEDFDYRQKRLDLLALGHDLILLEEKDGSVDMGVVLDFSTIKNFQLLRK